MWEIVGPPSSWNFQTKLAFSAIQTKKAIAYSYAFILNLNFKSLYHDHYIKYHITKKKEGIILFLSQKIVREC